MSAGRERELARRPGVSLEGAKAAEKTMSRMAGNAITISTKRCQQCPVILGKEVDYFGEELPASTTSSIGILCLEGEDPVMLMAPH